MDRSAHDGPPTPPAAALAFVVVHDVAASWTTYASYGFGLANTSVASLLLHAAGPTEDGFRIIDVWTSEGAYQHHRRIRGDRWPPGLAVPPVVRTLHVLDLVTSPAERDHVGRASPGKPWHR